MNPPPPNGAPQGRGWLWGVFFLLLVVSIVFFFVFVPR